MRFFDWHCDTLSKLAEGEKPFVTKSSLSAFEKPIQTFAIYTSDRYSEQEGYERAKAQLMEYTREEYPDSILSLENCKMLVEDGKTLEKFYNAGIFLFSLTHNGENQFAHGCASEGGLKERGKELLKVAEELGMTLDVSHLSRQSFYDVIDYYKGPIIASHSCFDAVCFHRRNLTDEMARLLFDRNGLVGINVYPPFCGGNSLLDVAKQIEHACLIGGAQHLAFGCDMDGIETMPKEISQYGDMLKLEKILLDMGLNQDSICGIFYLNSIRFLEENNYNVFLQHKR